MSITDHYYDLLKKEGGNKVSILTSFYKSLFDLENVNQDFFKRIGRLIKIYGEDLIFFSILDCSDVNNIDHDNPYGLIIYFAKKRLAERYNYISIPNLDNIIQKNIKELETKRRIKIPEVEI